MSHSGAGCAIGCNSESCHRNSNLLRLQGSLFGVVAGFWLVAGVLAVVGVVDFGLDKGAPLLGLLMLGNAAALGLAGFLSLRGHRLVDFGALAVVAVNALLSVTDEIGLLDLVSLAASVGLLVLLIYNMRAKMH